MTGFSAFRLFGTKRECTKSTNNSISLDRQMDPAVGEYNFSFIAGGLLVNELAAVAEVYHDLKDWDKTGEYVEVENLLRSRVASSGRRIFAEIRNRLQVLTEAQRMLLVEGVTSDQTAVAWVAVCKAYRIVREFAEEVVRERFVTLAMTVSGDDFDRFLHSKEAWEPRLESLAESTREKARTVVMRMLRESGITSEDGFIQPTLLSDEFVSVLRSDDASLYRIFPISDQDFGRSLA